MQEAHNYRPAAALINRDCQFHRSTLLLNLNCADNVPNIKFNAAVKTSKLDVLIEMTEMTSSLGNVNKPSGLHFRQFLKIIAHFKNKSHYASGLFDVKGTQLAIYLKKYKTFACHL